MEVINTIGRRKAAIARVYMSDGKGQIIVNGRDFKDYFPDKQLHYVVEQPLNLLEVRENYDIKVNLDGGGMTGQAEALRLGIARALIKDAPILILDEATSSLDSEAESVVQKALDNLMRGRTTMVIAHRLSTISGADHIAVIVDGRIVEEGQHDELMTRKGEYYKLHMVQYSAGQSGGHSSEKKQ